MKIFADMHHAGLFASFHYLFENRLGFELYRPIGMEWFEKGYWKIAETYNNNIGTVKQFLQVSSLPSDGTPPLNNTNTALENPILIEERNHGYIQKALRLDEFLALDIDVIIASIPAHIHAYRKLIRDYDLKAKLVYHIGNIFWHNNIPWHEVDNVMASVKPFKVPEGKNVVFYRQEFDTNLFKPLTPEDYEKDTEYFFPDNSDITSFVNCLPQPEKFQELKEWLPNFRFKAYGISCPDGVIDNISTIARRMQQSFLGYHNKPAGDGFGHVVHNWMAVGKPVIVNLNDYKDKLAGELLINGETCIDMSNRSMEEVAKTVYALTKDTDKYKSMEIAVISKFKEVVDFERDADNVRLFLNNLI